MASAGASMYVCCICVCGKCEFYEFTPPSTSAMPSYNYSLNYNNVQVYGAKALHASLPLTIALLLRCLACWLHTRLAGSVDSDARQSWWVGVQASVRRCVIINSIVINCMCWHVKIYVGACVAHTYVCMYIKSNKQRRNHVRINVLPRR